ncbi:uncharacterized protein LOC21404515 [Morus notabilis]|uniref:uncharacterized protein LOC21404515 n=1 Tax=Morus notabilis TaxID=981085 RepID=UPI000CED4D37|nr:uncharacterized protein LOC21404515 [Morus notabilis]
MANNDSKNNITVKTRYGVVAATAIPLIIIGGAYIVSAYLNRGWGRRKGQARVNKRSVSLAALHGGKLALERLVDYQEARADANVLKTALCELKVLFEEEPLDFLKLQRVVAKLEMSGHEAEAVHILQEEKTKAQNEGKILEAYEIEMLLVEMLIYKGEFEKAFSCKCLTEESMIADARYPLYKAIILIGVGRPRYEEKAKKYWQDFNDMREDFNDPPSFTESMKECLEGNGVCKQLATSFDEFKKIVLRLKDDINKTNEKRKKKNIEWK